MGVQVRPRLVLAIVSAGLMLATIDLFIVNIAFPILQRSFHGTPLSTLSWVLNAYTIVFAALLIPAGRLADRHGLKQSFLVGVAGFTVARRSARQRMVSRSCSPPACSRRWGRR